MEIIARLAPWILLLAMGHCQQNMIYPSIGGGQSRDMAGTTFVGAVDVPRDTESLGSLFRETIDTGGVPKDTTGSEGQQPGTNLVVNDPSLGGLLHEPKASGDISGGTSSNGGTTGYLDFGGIPHPPVNNAGAPRTPMDFGGIPRLRVNNAGEPRTPMDFGGIPHPPVNNAGARRTPMDFGGIPRLPVNNAGAPRTPMDFGGIPHPPVNNAGEPRTQVDFMGIPHNPVGTVGQPHTPIDFGGIPSAAGNREGLPREPIDSGGRRIPVDTGGIPHAPVVNEGLHTIDTLPPCRDVMCTLQFIPESCRRYETLSRGGMPCTGCPRWISGCTESPQDQSQQQIACPLLACDNNSIPPGCEYVETYDYHGRMCERCPVLRAGCSGANNAADSGCPVLDCIQIHIQPECRESIFYEFRGRQCEDCPKWKTGCTPSFSPDNSRVPGVVSPMSCPMLQCPEQIPPRCQVTHTVNINGRTCALCPTWSEMCQSTTGAGTNEGPPMACPLLQCHDIIPPQCQVQQSRQLNGHICPACPVRQPNCNIDGTVDRVACPMMACPRINIPVECKDESPYMFHGKQCFGCPKWRPDCGGHMSQPGSNIDFTNWINNRLDIHQEVVCPLINCKPLNVPSDCIQQEHYNFRGRQCLRCPTVNQNCFIMNQPRKFANIDLRMTNQRGRAVCPTMACPAIYIPPECRLETPFDFHGQTCYGCPQLKPGCQATGLGTESDTMADTAGNTVNDVSCPVMRCPYVLIPPECRVEQTYDRNGRTCTACPVWRDGCRSQIGTGNSGVTCPSIPCPRIYIPPECKDEEPFNFQGQTCYGCPKWRNGCMPGGRPLDVACPILDCQTVNIPPECVDETTYTLQGKTCIGCKTFREGCNPGQAPPVPDIACPKVGCPAIAISQECKEETTYLFQGKTCTGCPKMKDWCVHGHVLEVTCPKMACPLIYIPPHCKDEQPYDFKGKICYKCPKWLASCKHGLDSTPVQSGLPASTPCPLLKCDGTIPDECIEKQVYQFKGHTCEQCPIWRHGCVPKIPVRLVHTPKNVQTSSEAACPVTRCDAVYIPPECKDTPSYEFNGKTCFRCPIWRNGCSSSATGRGNALDIPTGVDATHTFAGVRNRGDSIVRSSENAVCPDLPCNRRIPLFCQRVTTYEYNGKTCPGCPIYNARCQRNMPNMNGLMAFRLFNELMLR